MRFEIGLVAALAMLVGCSGGEEAKTGTTGSETPSTEKALVVFSQANSQDPWRKVFDAETKAAAAKHQKHFEFDMQDAAGDPGKQNNIVDTFIVKQPKVLLISPTDDGVKPSVEKAFDAGIPVILLDRDFKGSDKFTAYIGGDNKDIGRQAGEYVAKRLNGKGTVLMIQGIAQIGPTIDRRGGFMEVMAKHPGITVIEGDDCGYQRQKARSYMETFLQKGQKIDCVYGHNDEMAIGARLAWDAANPSGGAAPIFVGIDACQQEVVDLIKSGKLDATFKYPTPGAAGVELAAKIIKGEKPTEKRMILPTEIVTKETADAYMTANPNLAK
ncbi:MAG: substrate-binding domain-containing protein [Chlorobia bacterium]|nr:substrate-binding domain-containing protein [Fimbriimonadaceae bacterium]